MSAGLSTLRRRIEDDDEARGLPLASMSSRGSANTTPGESMILSPRSRAMDWIDVVWPGVEDTEHTFDRLRALMRDDLPTLG
jgi:hypothetical protein